MKVHASTSFLEVLESAVAKSEAAHPQVKYDVLYTACKRIVRESRPIQPIENWKDGHMEAVSGSQA